MTPRQAQCAVAIAVAQHDREARAQAEAAVAALAPSPFLTARPIFADPSAGEPGWRNQAIEVAADRGDEWIFFVAPRELPAPALLDLLAPALEAYDAVWGGIGVARASGEIEVPRLARFSCSTEVEAFHMALHWWVGRSHLMRVAAARAQPFRPETGDAWYADYLLRHWAASRCLKTAQPLTLASELPRLGEADRALLLAELEKAPRPIRFQQGESTVLLPYTGRNPTLERVQLRGVFYEAAELAALHALVGPGTAVVDVGANTGNHTVYFAAVMQAARVVPVEPNASACAALRWAIAANGLTNVDTSRLGMAAGAKAARADARTGRSGHLGTATLAFSPEGGAEVAALDDMIDGRTDLLKIDAEGMEIDILTGARRLIERWRPVMMIEVGDQSLPAFLPLVLQMGYAVGGVFPDEGYANYLLVPQDRRG